MKKISWLFSVLIVLIMTPLLAVAQQQEFVTKVSSRIDEVTAYLNGAEIRTAYNLSLKKGKNRLIFKGLPVDLQDKSVQVTADGSTELLSVSTYMVAARPDEIDPSVRSVYDTLEDVRQRIESINNQVDAYEAEKSTLRKNEYIGGTQTGVSLTEVARAADFFRERTLKVNNALTVLHHRLKELTGRMDSLQKELDEKKIRYNPNRKEIVVVLNAAAEQKANFALRYLVTDAGWMATYDLIAADVNEPVTLKYKAQVYNNTGVDWKEVKLVLSTADPSQGATRPYLTTWTLNYTSDANEGLLENKAMGLRDNAKDDAYQDVAVTELSTSFPIPVPYSIPTGGELYTIEVSSTTLRASYEYLAVPKVDLSAFLIANITGWEKLNLIDGTANVYFGNTYIGESEINTRLIADTLQLSLGRDKQILVTRAKVEDAGSTKFIGSRRTESFRYEIQLKNNRKAPVTIKIQDQVPVSQESDISVEVEDISGASQDAQSGRLQWIKTIPPGDNTKLTVAFAVKYPKGKNVSIRQQRLIRSPRYRH